MERPSQRLVFRTVWPRRGLGRTGCPRNSSSTRQLLRRCLQRALPCTQNARAQWSLPCSKVKSTLRPRLVSTQPAVCAQASIFARVVPNTRRVPLVPPPHLFHDVHVLQQTFQLVSIILLPLPFINVIGVATSSQKVHRNIAAPRSCPRPRSAPGNQ